MKVRLPFLVAFFVVAMPVFMVGKLHKDGAINLDQFPPKIVKANLHTTPQYPTGNEQH